jgi:hypothetical protein
MTHPTYDQSDPKAGQPVLVGEQGAVERSGTGQTLACTFLALSCDDLGRVGVRVRYDNGVADTLLAHECRFYSTPPAPAIEPCVCGGEAEYFPVAVASVGYVRCKACHRSGAERQSMALARSDWNADQRALKAARKPQGT